MSLDDCSLKYQLHRGTWTTRARVYENQDLRLTQGSHDGSGGILGAWRTPEMPPLWVPHLGLCVVPGGD